MLDRTLFVRASSTAALLLAALSPAHAQTPTQAYYDMCLKAVDFPAPFGESDLKGNAKLPDYCKCFAPAFAARAEKAAQYMRSNPGKPPAHTLEQSNAEELALRNTCRKQTGLPAAVDPNGAAPAAGQQIPGLKRK